METVELTTGTRRLVLAGICEGLDGEAEAVAELVRELRPAVLALALEADSVDESVGWAPTEELTGEDALYKELLSAWGRVRLPPPEYGVAVQVADAQAARVVGVDIPEGHYVDLFTEQVSFWDLFKRSRRLRKLAKRPPAVDSAEALCRAFDAKVNQGAFAALEARREEVIARRLQAAGTEGTLVAILPIARLDGVASHLNDR